MIKKDEQGNMIYEKDIEGNEYWYEYNDNGDRIYEKDSNGYEAWNEYDSNGKLTHYRNSDGYEYWNNEEGSIIRKKDSYGYEFKYDSNEKLAYKKYPNGLEKWFDSEGKLTQVKAPGELMINLWGDGSSFGVGNTGSMTGTLNNAFREVAMKFANAVLKEIDDYNQPEL